MKYMIALLFFSFNCFCQQNSFRVFAVEGSVKISDKQVKFNSKFKKKQTLELNNKGFVILYNDFGQFVQLDKEGKYDYETIVKKAWPKKGDWKNDSIKNFVVKKLNEHKYNPKFFRYSFSKCGGPNNELMLPILFNYYDTIINVSWKLWWGSNSSCKKYNFVVKDFSDKEIYSKIIDDTIYKFSLKEFKLPKYKGIIIYDYPLECNIKSSNFAVLKLIEKPADFNLIDQYDPNKTEELSLLLTAMIAEYHRVYPVAKNSLRKLTSLHPNTILFKELYKIHLSRYYPEIEYEIHTTFTK